MAEFDRLPTTLIDLLANSVILRQIAPYVPLRSLLDLSATNSTIRDIFTQSEAWRHLDLSRVKSAMIEATPLDVGGISWRSQRMDEALTEDEFYAGPLRGIFSRLKRNQILKYVQTLILDGLSVPADIIREVATEPQYSVRILSIREAKNLNQSRLQQSLRYIVRPTRAEGTPRLKALYCFGSKDSIKSKVWQQQQRPAIATGVTASEGAQIGAAWNERSSTALSSTLSDDEARWYNCTGRLMKRPLSDWPETMRACKGLIAFDAVLCRGPRHDITKVDSKDFLQPAIATVALGPRGCETCGSCPEGPAVSGESPEYALPLLSPPPSHSSTLRAAQCPQSVLSPYPKLILRCEDCLRSRWCERCNRWWCEDCYVEPRSRVQPTELQQVELRDQVRNEGWEYITREVYDGETPQVKVYSKLCTEHCLVSEMVRAISQQSNS